MFLKTRHKILRPPQVLKLWDTTYFLVGMERSNNSRRILPHSPNKKKEKRNPSAVFSFLQKKCWGKLFRKHSLAFYTIKEVQSVPISPSWNSAFPPKDRTLKSHSVTFWRRSETPQIPVLPLQFRPHPKYQEPQVFQVPLEYVATVLRTLLRVPLKGN